jgi:hypothetical protein
MKQRGIFEKQPGSGIWWICYFDQFGKKRREKAGTKSVAIKLYGKRKQQVLEGKSCRKISANHLSNSVNYLTTRSPIPKGTSGLTRQTFPVLPA